MKNCPTCKASLAVDVQRCSACGTLFLTAPAGATTGPLQRLQFHGEGMGLLSLHLKNMLLVPLTLGIYYFWGKVSVRKYYYSQTSFGGDRFSYHGTGMERFKGFLRMMAFVAVIVALVMALDHVTGDEQGMLGSLIIYGAWGAVVPYAIVASRRYRLSRTALRGIRFSFQADLKDFYKLCLRGALLTLLTVGFYFPYLMHDVRAFLIRHSRYGTAAFTYDGRGEGFLWRHFLAQILGVLTCGIYLFWYQAFMDRYFWDHTSLDGTRFQSTVTGWGLCVLGITNLLLVVCTLGIGLPWAQVRTIRYQLSHLKLLGIVSLEGIRQDAMRAGVVGDEMVDMLGVDLGI